MMKNVKNKGTAPLDTRIKSEHDNSVSSLLSLSDHETPSLPPLGVEHTTSPLSPSGLTRGSRSYEYRMESGRSMVEILGTLAIIGVLSIGGIMGYSYGMDKYRANETINDIMLRRVDLTTQLDTHTIPNSNSWADDETIYPMDLTQMEDEMNGQPNIVYGIGISGVQPRVCQIIAEELSPQAQIIINGYQYNGSFNKSFCHINEQNDMDFFFIPNAECTTDLDCDTYGCSLCINGVCKVVPDGKYCLGNATCQSGECIIEDCHWTGWLDSGKPGTNHETGEDIESVEGICKGGRVENIGARVAMFSNTPLGELGQVVSVDTTNGLVCRNKDQTHMPGLNMPAEYVFCLNYEINVYCCYNRGKLKDQPVGTECTGHSDCCINGFTHDNNFPCITEDGKNGICSWGECKALSDGKCTTFEDCKTGEFCYTYEKSCHPLTPMTSYTVAGKTYYLSETLEKFWYINSTDYCNAFGKQEGKNMIPITTDDLKHNNNELLLALVSSEEYLNIWTQEGCGWYNEGNIGLLYNTGMSMCGHIGAVVCYNPDE